MMPDGLKLSVAFEIVEPVEVGVHSKGGIVKSDPIKSVLRDSIHTLGSRVVIVAVSLHVPKLGVVR